MMVWISVFLLKKKIPSKTLIFVLFPDLLEVNTSIISVYFTCLQLLALPKLVYFM